MEQTAIIAKFANDSTIRGAEAAIVVSVTSLSIHNQSLTIGD